MSAVTPLHPGHARSQGVWRAAWARFRQDRVGRASLAIVVAYLLMIAAVAAGWLAADWQAERGVSHAPPHLVGSTATSAG
ncbi:MAG TPA: ABC transporter permease, partial [Burkholderiaceae bacterium]|nr:ABC transporter permease [Burkholderiaceae bacterium]